MELIENIGFTDEDIYQLLEALDRTKSPNDIPPFGDFFKDVMGGAGGLRGSIFSEIGLKEERKKKERQELQENVIQLQHKLIRFKEYLKQPTGPAKSPDEPAPRFSGETSADAKASAG